MSAPKTRRVPYRDARGRKRQLSVQADWARELDLFDRNMRRRDELWRENHRRFKADGDGEIVDPATTAKPTRLAGYLNFELEEAAKAILPRTSATEWKGPRARFSVLLGTSPTWDGPESFWKPGSRVCRLSDRRTVWLWHDGGAFSRCRFCGHLEHLPPDTACLSPDCGRTGIDARESLPGPGAGVERIEGHKRRKRKAG